MKHKIYGYDTILIGKQLLKAYKECKEAIIQMFLGLQREAPLQGASRTDIEEILSFSSKDGDPFTMGQVWSMLGKRERGQFCQLLERDHAKDPKTIFFESALMPDGLAKQSTRVNSLSVRREWDVVSVTFPKGSKIMGFQARPFLFKKVNAGGTGKEVEWQKITTAIDTLDFVRFETPHLFVCFDFGVEGKGQRCYRWDLFVRVLDKGDKHWSALEREGLPKTEPWERAHLRFLAGLLIFIDAFGDRLVKGLPVGTAPDAVRPHGKVSQRARNLQPYTFKWPVVPETGKPFSWTQDHLVYYAHEKFVNVKGTYRVRRGHIRGEHLDPYTVTKPGARA